MYMYRVITKTGPLNIVSKEALFWGLMHKQQSHESQLRSHESEPWTSGLERACYDHPIIFISTLETTEIGLNSSGKNIWQRFGFNQISLTDKKFSVHSHKQIYFSHLFERISWLDTPFES